MSEKIIIEASNKSGFWMVKWEEILLNRQQKSKFLVIFFWRGFLFISCVVLHFEDYMQRSFCNFRKVECSADRKITFHFAKWFLLPRSWIIIFSNAQFNKEKHRKTFFLRFFLLFYIKTKLWICQRLWNKLDFGVKSLFWIGRDLKILRAIL